MSRMRASSALAVGLLALAAPPASAAPGTLGGRLSDGALPAAATGRASLRAVRLTDGALVAARRVGRTGAWSLRLPTGYYVLAATVVRIDKPVVSAISPVQRVRSGRTTRTSVSLRRTKTPRKRRRVARRRAGAAATPSPTVAVQRFTATGPHPQLGRGLADMVQGELVNARSGDCEPTVLEWEHRADLQREIALSNSTIADPSARIPSGRLIDPAVFVRGSVTTTSSSTAWSIRLVDARTGDVLGEDTGTAAGAAIFDAPADIAQRLTDQLCGGDYHVSVRINAAITVPPYSGTAVVTAEVPVVGVSGTTPPTAWLGQADVAFLGLQYGGVPDCVVVPGAHSGYVRVEIKPLPPDMIQVTWGGETNASTTVVCAGHSIPNGVPPIMPFQMTLPTLLILPSAGGTQSVAGSLGAPGGAWINSGTVTVTRVPRGTN